MATPEEQELAFMPTTNDACEGLLGAYHVSRRAAETLTEETFNAVQMVRRNETEEFATTRIAPEVQATIMRKAREQGAASSKAQRANIVAKQQQKIDGNRLKERVRKERVEKEKQRLDAVKLWVDLEWVQRGWVGNPKEKVTCAKLDEQLDAHRRIDKRIPLKSHIPNKKSKEAALIAAIRRAIDAEIGTSESSTAKDADLGQIHTDQLQTFEEME
jgi:hypothetical protein